MPRAAPDTGPTLDPDELAWLATQDDVESRLIFTVREGSSTSYRVEHGPFEDGYLAALPRQDWTLLVHDVEKHLPDFRALFSAVFFIPDWRIDDLMISFAAPGGGAGPHRDNYDVFLCQGAGIREWRLGTEDDCIDDESSGELSLLTPFVDDSPQVANKSDVLYLPPGIPHWGIARRACMTSSIGMRSPSVADLKVAAARLYGIDDALANDASVEDTEVFYGDPDLSIEEAVPGQISGAAIDRVRNMLDGASELDERRAACAIGSVVTEPKAWLVPECPTGDEADGLIAALGGNSLLTVHGMARIAWARAGGTALIFANGQAREVPQRRHEVFRDLCQYRQGNCEEFSADGDTDLLRWLLATGVFDLTESSR